MTTTVMNEETAARRTLVAAARTLPGVMSPFTNRSYRATYSAGAAAAAGAESRYLDPFHGSSSSPYGNGRRPVSISALTVAASSVRSSSIGHSSVGSFFGSLGGDNDGGGFDIGRADSADLVSATIKKPLVVLDGAVDLEGGAGGGCRSRSGEVTRKMAMATAAVKTAAEAEPDEAETHEAGEEKSEDLLLLDRSDHTPPNKNRSRSRDRHNLCHSHNRNRAHDRHHDRHHQNPAGSGNFSSSGPGVVSAADDGGGATASAAGAGQVSPPMSFFFCKTEQMKPSGIVSASAVLVVCLCP